MMDDERVEAAAKAISRVAWPFVTWERCKQQDSVAFMQHVSMCYAYARAALSTVESKLKQGVQP